MTCFTLCQEPGISSLRDSAVNTCSEDELEQQGSFLGGQVQCWLPPMGLASLLGSSMEGLVYAWLHLPGEGQEKMPALAKAPWPPQ